MFRDLIATVVDERDTLEQEKDQLAKQIEDTQDKVCPPTSTVAAAVAVAVYWCHHVGRDQLIFIERYLNCHCYCRMRRNNCRPI